MLSRQRHQQTPPRRSVKASAVITSSILPLCMWARCVRRRNTLPWHWPGGMGHRGHGRRRWRRRGADAGRGRQGGVHCAAVVHCVTLSGASVARGVSVAPLHRHCHTATTHSAVMPAQKPTFLARQSPRRPRTRVSYSTSLQEGEKLVSLTLSGRFSEWYVSVKLSN